MTSRLNLKAYRHLCAAALLLLMTAMFITGLVVLAFYVWLVFRLANELGWWMVIVVPVVMMLVPAYLSCLHTVDEHWSK